MAKRKKSSRPFLQKHPYPYPGRAENTRQKRLQFLIVCQGTKTEPNYFKQFRSSRLTPKVKCMGLDPFSLVSYAIEVRAKNKYEQTWVVFDRDRTTKECFDKAIALAEKEKIQVAYSNLAFELWFLLHFEYLNSAQTPQDYIRSLERYLALPYDKTDDTVFFRLLPRQSDALHNAQHLLAQYQPPNPWEDDPSTTVHLLVEQLNRFQ